MKNLIQSKIFVLIIAGLVTGCAGSKKGSAPETVLANMNPAPASMTPKMGEGETVDPTYLRTQADYYFAVGESYSLEGNSQKAIESFKLATVYDQKSPEVYLRLATEYVRAGLLSEAIEQAETGLEKDPEHRDLHLFIGGLYATMKVYNKALEHYKVLLAKDSKDQGVQLYVGALYADQGDHAEARNAFYNVTKIKAKNEEEDKSHLAYLYLGKLELIKDAKAYAKAEKHFKSALKSQPDFEEAIISLAAIYEEQGEKDLAIKTLESFQKTHGPKKAVAQTLSQHYLQAEDYKKALVHLRVLEEFDPSNLSVQMKIALILIEQKEYDDAIDRLERILSATPESDKVRYYLAAVYEELKDNSLAIQNYTLIDPVSNYFPDASIRAANLLKENNKLSEAMKLIEKAIGHRVDSSHLFSFYAALLDESKQYNKGVNVLEKAEKSFPKNTQIKYYLGNFYDRLDNKTKTISKMREIIDLDPNHFAALNYLAYTLADSGKSLDEAERLALRALDLQPENAYILDTVGWVYHKKGNSEEAIRYLEAAFKKKPDESIIAEHLGDAYYVYQLPDKAKDMYQRAAKLETNAAKATEIRRKITNIERPQVDRVPASMPSGN